MSQLVLVTGAAGFLGSHLVRELLGRGYGARALVRSVAGAKTINELNIQFWEGDLTQPDSVRGCAEGCVAIIHAAALAQANPARNPALWTVNLGGTQTILAEARRAAIGRFIYVGTANVFGFGTLADPGDETRPFAGQRYGSDYMDSKLAATQAVLRAVTEDQFPALLVHPTFMLGPLDAKPTSGQLLLELYRGRLVGYPIGGKNYVHVTDVATATVNALTMGQIGASYILGNQNLSYRDAFGLMARVMGVRPPRWPLPPALARFYGTLCETKTRLTGRPALVNRSMIEIANDGHYFRADKAIQSLALLQTPIEKAVREAFDWFRTHHYVS